MLGMFVLQICFPQLCTLISMINSIGFVASIHGPGGMCGEDTLCDMATCSVNSCYSQQSLLLLLQLLCKHAAVCHFRMSR